TPFNIGHAIDLGELSRADALPLAQGLDAAYPGQGATLLDRVFTWTNGHPYLTQKVCQALVEQVDYFLKSGHEVQHSDQKANSFYACVDRTVHHLFLDIDAQNEDNLRFVHSNIQASDERRRLLQIYRRVYTGTHVSEDERSPLHNRLKLIGLVRSQAGALQVRNEIYRCVFNHAWIKQNMPIDWTRIITIGSLIVVLLTIAWYLFIQRQQTVQRFAQLTITFENRDSIVNLRMLSLAVMCDTQRVQARVVFYRQPPEDQLTLLREVNPTVVKEKLTTITHCLMPPPDTLDENHRHEIEDALHEAQERGMNQR
ncbi:MAG: hypothetical protein KDE58_42120, partial [Caldilineaceae bacterium]|nr:hypothetical protein [Caldilineaceae bacterium]